MGTIVIAGGGMCGLAAAMVLADDGHRVTVIERDEAPPPPGPDGAHTWSRQGVAQFGLAHWLHARGAATLRDQLPQVFELLTANGAYRFNLVAYLLAVQGAAAEPGDERYEVVTGRRSTLEWAMATAAAAHPGVTVRRGEAIAGFTTGAPAADGVPHVTGLRLESGAEVTGDLVVDATGRRSPTPRWLAAIGAAEPAEDSVDSGFAYYGRYFRSADGSMPAIFAPLLSPIGSFSLLTLPADNGTWSVTVYGQSDDAPLRRARDPEVFERIVQACPLHAHWLAGEPIGDMLSMAGIVDRHRRFVVDGRPCATGVLSVGDASSCTNPSLGRGITLGLMHVEVLRGAVVDHLGDPLALAHAFHERTEARLWPWHEATQALDRTRLREMAIYAEGGTPERGPADGLVGALSAGVTADPAIARAFGDIFSCYATAEEVFARPGFLDHVRAIAPSLTIAPVPGPDRAALLELVA